MQIRKGCIRSVTDLEEAILQVGFLPFFHTDGVLSLEDLAAASVWFTEKPGPWEWKGELARDKRCVYGKFSGKGAAFVAPDLFPDLINLRRDGYDFEGYWEDGLATRVEHGIMQYVEEHGPSISKHIRKALDRPKTYDRDLIALQMRTFLIPVDFVQDLDAQGRPYGWGNGVMDTPEHAYGLKFVESRTCTKEESLSRILSRMKEILTGDAAHLILGTKKTQGAGRKPRASTKG